MQLENIRIEKLFGRFDYCIDLRKAEKITIIHAPNGFGKTVLLTLINAFFGRNFGIFFKYNFFRLQLQFEGGLVLEVERIYDADLFPAKTRKAGAAEIVISASPKNNEMPAFRMKINEGVHRFNRFLPFIEPAGSDAWLDENYDEIISTVEVLSRYREHLPPDMRGVPKLPNWLDSLISSTECRLIETQRLLRIGRSEEAHRAPHRRGVGLPRPVVEMEARDLANRIGVALADYANRSQSLDQSFPRRIIEALASGNAPEAQDVSGRIKAIEDKRLSLIEAGLLDRAGAPEILSAAQLQSKVSRQVIGVYLDDMEQKFSRFDALFRRVSLFKEIISEKFRFKTLGIAREQGMSILSDDGLDISLSDLSSGEQHELVLIYELLFGVKEGALILIDEPELSLHVGWQIRFLPDLQRIQRLNPLQIIIATHSPQIINERWDLAVELKN